MAKHLVPEGTKDIAIGAPVAVLAEEASGVAALASFSPGAAAAPAPAPAAPASAAPSPAAAATQYPPHQVRLAWRPVATDV